MGAWIEIGNLTKEPQVTMAAPFMGAWIEIS